MRILHIMSARGSSLGRTLLHSDVEERRSGFVPDELQCFHIEGNPSNSECCWRRGGRSGRWTLPTKAGFYTLRFSAQHTGKRVAPLLREIGKYRVFRSSLRHISLHLGKWDQRMYF